MAAYPVSRFVVLVFRARHERSVRAENAFFQDPSIASIHPFHPPLERAVRCEGFDRRKVSVRAVRVFFAFVQAIRIVAFLYGFASLRVIKIHDPLEELPVRIQREPGDESGSTVVLECVLQTDGPVLVEPGRFDE